LVLELDPLYFDFTVNWVTIMATTGEGYYDQGRSTTRSPLFKGTNFFYWKILMQMFIKIEDCELWNIVVKGPYIPKTTIGGKLTEKTED